MDKVQPIKSWNRFAEAEKYNSFIQSLFNLTPQLPIKYELLEKGTQVHKTSDNTVYVREGAQSIPVKDPEKIRALGFAKGITSFEEDKLPNLRVDEIVDSQILKEFLTDFSPKSEPLDYLLNEYLLDTKSWEPKYASILLFHKNPAAALPKRCAVKIIRYETKEDEPERDHLKVTHTNEGSLYKLIHESVARVTEILSEVKIWTVEGIEKVKYPPETLWEVTALPDSESSEIFTRSIKVESRYVDPTARGTSH